MTRRLAFLCGNLSGIAICAGLAIAFLRDNYVPSLSATKAVPVNRLVVPVSLLKNPRAHHKPGISPDWEERYFNGQTYYIVPLESAAMVGKPNGDVD